MPQHGNGLASHDEKLTRRGRLQEFIESAAVGTATVPANAQADRFFLCAVGAPQPRRILREWDGVPVQPWLPATADRCW